jgi:hypothetical protein
MEWISVKDRLPNDLKEVLLFHIFKEKNVQENYIIFVGYLDKLNREWVCGWDGMFPPYEDNPINDFFSECFRLKINEITHWMPLPKPPIV